VGTLRGKKFRIRALGCRTNQYEAEAVVSELILRGAVPSENEWDFAILLSCTVTSEADRKSRQQVRRYRRENPQGIILAAGCWVQELEEAEATRLGIDAAVGNRLKSLIPETLEKLFEAGSRPEKPVFLRIPSPPSCGWDPLALEKPALHTRAFIKVQDGCDHFCSYCIVPFVRGAPVSREPADILSEIGRVARSGCSEVVLTGVHLGLFGANGPWTLSRLVEEIARVPGMRRIRFGSLEPFALDDELIRTLARTASFCPHLHLPLQSGDDRVLAAMRRGYNSADFARIVGRIRELWPENLHLSTDLLVGFPGETDEAFQRTLALVRELGFGHLHVFPYSPRPGTLAASMEGHLPEALARARCEEGIAVGDELLGKFTAPFLGTTVPVLVEKARDGELKGLTPHFLPVRWKGNGVPGRIENVRVSFFEKGEFRA
jgi:threonylcarbamoyladenosine tRNA methylthiotransferase MtaB